MTLTRRGFLKTGAVAGAAASFASAQRAPADSEGDFGEEFVFRFKRFRRDLPIPSVLEESTLIPGPGGADHGIAPEFSPVEFAAKGGRGYHIIVEPTLAQILPPPLPMTPVFTYRDANANSGEGTVPGPTILSDFDAPNVVRFENRLLAGSSLEHDIEISTHLHGGHTPAHADGFPNFYVLPGKTRDYFYPNLVPKRRIDGSLQFDMTTVPSTMWYHDHAMDITGHNVSHGLAGFYLLTDDLEKDLMGLGGGGGTPALPDVTKLVDDPENSFDIPMVLMDQQLNADGELIYDFLDHNGRIGRTFTVNGIAQPRLKVKRGKYRFRILNGSNARVYMLRLSNRQPFLIVGNDSWLLPKPVSARKVQLAMSERVDIIVDFSNAAVGDKIFLENIMAQDDGRGPDGVDKSEKVRLLKFKVVSGSTPDIDIDTSTDLRPHQKIVASDIVRTRVFEFDRGNGAWEVNERFFNPRRADAVPVRDDANGQDAERWILRNDGGGWWHPIHIHLEHHEIQKINGRRPKKHRRFKSDVTTLAGDDEAVVFMRFRTFSGPFVFHCHNLEHEDMRMMATFDPQPDGETDLNGVDPITSEISGIDEVCGGNLLTVAAPGAADEHEPFVDVVADLETLEDEGVGFPCTDFSPGEED